MDNARRLGHRYSPQLRRPIVQMFVIAGAAVAIIGLALTLVLASIVERPNPTERTAPNAPAPPRGQAAVSSTIQVDPGVTDLVAGFGSVWASTPNTVFRIDAQSNEIVAKIPIDAIGDTGKMAVGEGSVWVTHDADKISRIDPDSNEVVATINVGPGVRGVAVGGGGVWVTLEPQPDEIEGHLVRIDPKTDEVVGVPLQIGVSPGPVAFAGGAVWVTLTSEEGTLVRVDPESMAKEEEILGVRGAAGSVGDEVWAATGDSIMRIDPSTGAVFDEIPVPLSWQVGFGSNAAWVLTLTGSIDPDVYVPDPEQPSTVGEFDANTGAALGEPVAVGNSPSFMTVGEGAVWVAQYDSGTIQRIDPAL